jgi:hypothetical protein
MTEPLTEEQINEIKYFHEYKGDVTRWIGWEGAQPQIREHHPTLFHCYQAMKIHEHLLDLAIKNLGD